MLFAPTLSSPSTLRFDSFPLFIYFGGWFLIFSLFSFDVNTITIAFLIWVRIGKLES